MPLISLPPALSQGISAPVLVITDNEVLRTELQAGLMPGFVTTPYLARSAE